MATNYKNLLGLEGEAHPKEITDKINELIESFAAGLTSLTTTVTNNKSSADTSISNLTSTKLNINYSNKTYPWIRRTYVNGAQGYILFNPGSSTTYSTATAPFIIQWGRVARTKDTPAYTTTVSLIKKMYNINYNIQITLDRTAAGSSYYAMKTVYETKKVDSFQFHNTSGYASTYIYWLVTGAADTSVTS